VAVAVIIPAALGVAVDALKGGLAWVLVNPQ
jgi:hypothetical protein